MTDVLTFLRRNSHVALRDPAVFIDSCKMVCMLSSSNPSGSNYSITLKSDTHSSPQHGDAAFDMPVVPLSHFNTAEENGGHQEVVLTGQTAESLDKLLRHLLSEVTRVGKTVARASCCVVSSENVPFNRPASDGNMAAPVQSSDCHAAAKYNLRRKLCFGCRCTRRVRRV